MVSKDNHLNHDCECGECACSEDDRNIVSLMMEDGTEKEFEILQVIEHEGKSYLALCEAGSFEYDILRVNEVDDEVELNVIEDDAEYEQVAELFDEVFSGGDDLMDFEADDE